MEVHECAQKTWGLVKIRYPYRDGVLGVVLEDLERNGGRISLTINQELENLRLAEGGISNSLGSMR